MSIDGWIKKIWGVCVLCVVCVRVYIKGWNNATCSNLEIIILSKLDREGQIPYNVAYIWNLKK